MDAVLSGDTCSMQNIYQHEIFSAHDLVTRLPAHWSQWCGAVVASVMVGLTGVLPLILVPAKITADDSAVVSEENLKYLLGFAVGGLLGDVFLHLLPETYQQVRMMMTIL